MPEHSVEVRKILWAEAVPPMRLLATFSRALRFGPIAPGLAFVFIAVVIGGAMDATWVYFGNGAIVAPTVATRTEELRSEIEAFAVLDSSGFRDWRRVSAERRGPAPDDSELDQRVAEARKLVDARVQRGLDVIAADAQLSSGQRSERRARLLRAADVVRFQLAGRRVNPYPAIEPAAAIETVLSEDPNVTVATRTTDAQALRDAIRRAQAFAQWHASAPRGPFAALMDYEMHSAAAAIRGAVTGRWGLQAPAHALEPSLLGSLVSGAKGLLWLGVERPLYALCFFVLLLVLAAPFAGMICRLTAIAIARDEEGENRKAYFFMQERRWSMVGAPFMCVAIALGVALLVAIGSVAGALPYVGPLLSGLFFFLALLGGSAAALFVLLLMLGFPLMWPTIAVEGSESFDAVQRGGMYTFDKPGLIGLCYLIVLLNWTVALLAARLVAMLALKITHCAVDGGMSLFRTSVATDTIGRLEAMWWMPAWQDLALLPTPGDVPFWGILNYAPLAGDERIGAFLIGLWIWLVVGLVAGFAVAFVFSGLTETYFILRRVIDGTDYTEIYFERIPDDFSSLAPETDPASSPGKPLPVVTPPS